MLVSNAVAIRSRTRMLGTFAPRSTSEIMLRLTLALRASSSSESPLPNLSCRSRAPSASTPSPFEKHVFSGTSAMFLSFFGACAKIAHAHFFWPFDRHQLELREEI
jgi:hypothetical protein